MPPGGQGGRRAAAGEAGAADSPEHERVPGDGSSAARRERMLPLNRATFAAPALPAAARRSPSPPYAARSPPPPTRDEVSGRGDEHAGPAARQLLAGGGEVDA